MSVEAYLDESEQNWDEEAGLVAGLSGEPYHLSRIPPGKRIHHLLGNLYYAWGLLESGKPERIQRTARVLSVVAAQQDIDPTSTSYGAWSHYLEEPVQTTPRPKMFGADFPGVALCHILLEHEAKLARETAQTTRNMLKHAGYCTFRHNFGVPYSNYAVMGACVCIVGGELLNDAYLFDYGKAKLRDIEANIQIHGGYAEWNSPTYTFVTMAECERIIQLAQDSECRERAMRALRAGWEEVAHYYHPRLRQMAGPHSRAYHNHVQASWLQFVKERTGLEIAAHAAVSPGTEKGGIWMNIKPQPCPTDLLPRLNALPQPEFTTRRLLYRSYVNEEPDFYSTTWFAEDAALGSVNLEDLWYQRRSVLGYWQTPEDFCVTLRARFLHDDYDFSSAYIRNAQDGPRVLSAFGLLTNMGDRMAHIDPPEDGLFAAEDFRVRYELSGAGVSARSLGGGRYEFSAGARKAVVHTLPGRFGPHEVSWELGKKDGSVFVDGICYRGARKKFNLQFLGEVAIAAGLEVLRSGDRPAPEGPVLKTGAPSADFYEAQWSVGAGLRVAGPLNAILYPGYKGGEMARQPNRTRPRPPAPAFPVRA
ncbi:MAG: hypothetical protein HY291_12685 [Planctomycetes bacterium]|nr:hypothetical protein [Planctomycetota bacterium]